MGSRQQYVPEGFDPIAVAEIRQRLEQVRADGVRIGFAIESGSRAWGFPSPDSDYDCRFVYVRSPRDHTGLFAYRDVIEFPIVGDIDTGGWDLRKALKLALNGNAVLVEWVKSPIAYEEQPGFRKRLGDLLDEIMIPERVALHYVGLLRRHLAEDSSQPIKLKKLLYSLRPVIALDWMRQASFAKLPPMNMLECLQGIEMRETVRSAILELVALKQQTREMGEGLPPALIASYLDDARARYGEFNVSGDTDMKRGRNAEETANSFYQTEVWFDFT